MFSVHTTPGKFKNAAIGGYSAWICVNLKKTRSGKLNDYRKVIVYEKPRFQKRFSSKQKRKAVIFKFLRFVERFRKAPFS